MKKSLILWAFVIAVVVVAIGWYRMQSSQPAAPNSDSNMQMNMNGSSDQGMSQSDMNMPQQAQSGTSGSDGTGPAQNLTLGTDSNAKVGTYLISYTGMTLYTYAKDTNNKSNCTGACAQTWPPYTLPAGTPINLQAGVSGTVSMISRDDGSWQVSYNGHPLYFYAGDKTGSDVKGQGIGGVWYVAKP